jgi:hypothetical protein
LKLNGLPLEENSRDYIKLLELLARDEVLPTVAPQMVPPITAKVREPFAELDSYRAAEARLLRDCNETPFLMRRQAS